MLNRRLFLGSLAAGALASDRPITPRQPVRLFNGHNLDGWYTWLRENRYEDPAGVFSVVDGQLKISGTEWGGLATKSSYRDYHLVAEWRWGGPAHGERATKAGASGILLHATGRDGAYSGIWLESIECQIIEGGCGDFILVGGDAKPAMTAEVRQGENNQVYWERGGTPLRKNSGRFNWYARDPNWKDELDFRGANDLENPVGEWNRSEAICRGNRITNLVNGKVVNEGYDASHTEGKIQIQSEGAEIWFRRIDLMPLGRG